MNLLIKPDEQNQACLNYAMAGKSCAKVNLLIKPDEQNQACLNYAMAGKSCAKANLFRKLEIPLFLQGLKNQNMQNCIVYRICIVNNSCLYLYLTAI